MVIRVNPSKKRDPKECYVTAIYTTKCGDRATYRQRVVRGDLDDLNQINVEPDSYMVKKYHVLDAFDWDSFLIYPNMSKESIMLINNYCDNQRRKGL